MANTEPNGMYSPNGMRICLSDKPSTPPSASNSMTLLKNFGRSAFTFVGERTGEERPAEPRAARARRATVMRASAAAAR